MGYEDKASLLEAARVELGLEKDQLDDAEAFQEAVLWLDSIAEVDFNLQLEHTYGLPRFDPEATAGLSLRQFVHQLGEQIDQRNALERDLAKSLKKLVNPNKATPFSVEIVPTDAPWCLKVDHVSDLATYDAMFVSRDKPGVAWKRDEEGGHLSIVASSLDELANRYNYFAKAVNKAKDGHMPDDALTVKPPSESLRK